MTFSFLIFKKEKNVFKFCLLCPPKTHGEISKCILGAPYSMTIPLRKGKEYYPYSERFHMHS
jgi:hypothetical protein